MTMLTTGTLAYCYWGLGLALGPLVVVNYARQAEMKGIPIDFPFFSEAGAHAAVERYALDEDGRISSAEYLEVYERYHPPVENDPV